MLKLLKKIDDWLFKIEIDETPFEHLEGYEDEEFEEYAPSQKILYYGALAYIGFIGFAMFVWWS